MKAEPFGRVCSGKSVWGSAVDLVPRRGAAPCVGYVIGTESRWSEVNGRCLFAVTSDSTAISGIRIGIPCQRSADPRTSSDTPALPPFSAHRDDALYALALESLPSEPCEPCERRPRSAAPSPPPAEARSRPPPTSTAPGSSPCPGRARCASPRLAPCYAAASRTSRGPRLPQPCGPCPPKRVSEDEGPKGLFRIWGPGRVCSPWVCACCGGRTPSR